MRHTLRAAVWSSTVILATGAVALPVFGAGRRESADSPSATPTLARTTLIERATCTSDDVDASASRHPSTAGAEAEISQALSVSVPRIAMVSFDDDDRIAAVATNTGCAPRAGDEVYIVLDDGNLVAAPDLALEGIEWRGDFTSAGVFQAQ